MKIAVGNSRMDKKWKNQDISWTDLCARCGSTIRTTETVEEYRKLKKGQQDGIKDVGGFVGGHLREGRRKNGMVLCRSLLTLDMDYGTPDIWDEITLFHDFKCCVYSTHKHTSEHPRLRLLIPLKREISEEEYPAVARMVAKEIGIDLFDDTTYEASRLMYWPSTSANGEFFYKVQDGAELDPDEYLSRYDDWHDASTWPVSSRQSEVVQHSIAQQADPLTKPGVVGAFCRAYTVEEAIDTFLSDVYLRPLPGQLPGSQGASHRTTACRQRYMACGDSQMGSSAWADLLGGGRHGNRAQGGTPAAGQRVHHQP